MLQDLHTYESTTLNQVLAVLEEGLGELKGEVDAFPDLMNANRIPEQYLDLLWETLGLPRAPGLSSSDRRAVLQAIGGATPHRGNQHGLRLILRALWRFSAFEETYQDIYEEAEADGSVNAIADWDTWLSNNGYTESDLLEILLKVELDVDDSREYGAMQAAEYRQLLEELKKDSGYESLFRTYRPGFDASAATLLGTSQFDDNGLLSSAYLLYGTDTAFLDEGSQNLLEALKWNVYPDIKIDRVQSVLDHFIPLITHVTYDITGYRQADDVVIGYADALNEVTVGTETIDIS